jgi:hypothetical protein
VSPAGYAMAGVGDHSLVVNWCPSSFVAAGSAMAGVGDPTSNLARADRLFAPVKVQCNVF